MDFSFIDAVRHTALTNFGLSGILDYYSTAIAMGASPSDADQIEHFLIVDDQARKAQKD